jgi:hypothetical protein
VSALVRLKEWRSAFADWLIVYCFTSHSRILHGGCDRSAENAYSFTAPDPTSGVSTGPCKPDFHYIIPCTWSRHWFWLRIFPFTWLDSPILTADCSIHLIWNHRIFTTDIWIWNGAHGGCDRSAEDAHSSAAPDPTFAFVGGPCCPTLDFVIAFWITIVFHTLLTSLFCAHTCNIRKCHHCWSMATKLRSMFDAQTFKALSKEGFLSDHTCCNTGSWLYRFHWKAYPIQSSFKTRKEMLRTYSTRILTSGPFQENQKLVSISTARVARQLL